jgi:hypothetical protein
MALRPRVIGTLVAVAWPKVRARERYRRRRCSTERHGKQHQREFTLHSPHLLPGAVGPGRSPRGPAWEAAVGSTTYRNHNACRRGVVLTSRAKMMRHYLPCLQGFQACSVFKRVYAASGTGRVAEPLRCRCPLPRLTRTGHLRECRTRSPPGARLSPSSIRRRKAARVSPAPGFKMLCFLFSPNPDGRTGSGSVRNEREIGRVTYCACRLRPSILARRAADQAEPSEGAGEGAPQPRIARCAALREPGQSDL